MNDDTNSKPNVSATTCRIGPPADDRFDEEAFLLREMAEAKAALRRTAGAVKDHARDELKPGRVLRRHPLAAAGAFGLGGLLIVRRIFRARSPKPCSPERPAEPVAKTGLVAMLVPSIVAVVQSLSAAKMSNAQAGQAAPVNPQAWMVKTLWGLARDRFGNRRAPAREAASAPADTAPAAAANAGANPVGPRAPNPVPMPDSPHRRRGRAR
jgi:hypothetical protein